MRVFPCMFALVFLCTTASGCALFKKNTNGNNPGGGGPAAAVCVAGHVGAGPP